MFKQIDRCEDERQNMPLRETVQPHRQQRHDEICLRDAWEMLWGRCCLLLLCRWLLVWGLCVSVWRPQRKTEKVWEIKRVHCVRMCEWVCLPDLISTAGFVLLTVYVWQVKGKRKQTPKFAYAHVFVIKHIFSQRLASKPVLTHVRGKQELIEAHYSDVLQTSQRLNQISGWASLTSAAVCSLRYDRISWLV